MKKKYNFLMLLVFLFAISFEIAEAKKIYCIDVDPNDNGFLSNLEGWARQNLKPGDEIHVGGDLDECIEKAKNGDTVIVGCHGWGVGRGFKWANGYYRGFGTGDSLLPLPPGIDTVKNVRIEFISCWSGRDPDGAGPDSSVADKLKNKLGPPSNGNSVGGYTNRVFAGNCVFYTYDPALTDTATINNFLRNGNQSWQKAPPVNRIPPPQVNQRTRLQALLDSVKGGAGRVVVGDIVYKAPFNGTNSLLDTCFCNCNTDLDCGCTATEIISIPICSPATYDWIPQISGTLASLYSVSAVDSKVCWAAGAGPTVIRTTDGGFTWTTVTGSGLFGDIYTIHAVDADTAFCSSTPASTILFKTTNGGVTWVSVFVQAGGFINSIQMTYGPDGYALGDPVGGKWTVLKTTTYGSSWFRIPTEPTQIGGEAGWANSFQVSNSQIWFGTNSSKVYVSSNFGISWAGIPTPGVLSTYALYYSSSVHGLAGGTGLVKSLDGGFSYSPASSPSPDISGLEGHGQNWWATGFDPNVYMSTNHGTNWSIVYTHSGSTFWDIDMVSEGGCAVGWAIGLGGRVAKMSGEQMTALNLTGLLEGFGSIGDTLKVFIRKATAPYAVADVAQGKTDGTGNVSLIFNNPQLRNGDSYFIEVRHRNSIRTWSKAGGEVWLAGTLNFDFTNSLSKAYGDNMVLVGGSYRFYGGDINQDDIVDGTDAGLVDNDAANFVTGYVVTDVTGDDIVDGSDAAIVDNNASAFVTAVIP